VVFGHWTSRISILRKKNIEILVSNLAKFREKEILPILAHEIDVHLVRYLNAKKTWWKILLNWTGFYSVDEEGLAIYKSFEQLLDGYEKKSLYERYYIISKAKDMDFVELWKIFLDQFKYNYVSAFRLSFRAKRWIVDTWNVSKWLCFMKDKVYLDGYLQIKNWIEKWWNIDKLMIWKIKIADLKYFV